jgi:hypothetical protein
MVVSSGFNPPDEILSKLYGFEHQVSKPIGRTHSIGPALKPGLARRGKFVSDARAD